MNNTNIDEFIQVVSVDTDNHKINKTKTSPTPPLQQCILTAEDSQLAYRLSLVPEAYMNAKFDEENIKANLRKQRQRDGGLYTIYGFNKYFKLCIGILGALRTREKINGSYLIGAPNSFGKTSFANECIITCMKQGYNTVPFISLWELAQIRVDNEQRISNPFKKFINNNDIIISKENNLQNLYPKDPTKVTGKFSYSEYINADCLFTYFTDVVSRDIESHTLYQLLNIRGSKGLPTIVMISTSIDPYLNDTRLKELVWDDILSYKNEVSFDRVTHISTFKKRANNLMTQGKDIEKDTGILLSDNN